MKLTTVTNVTVDGVMQGLGAPDEDRRGGFERGGWAGPLFDRDTAEFLGQVYQRADAFLFGRWTYEVFAGSWGQLDNSVSPIAAALNTKPKYVASTTLTDPGWADTTVLASTTLTDPGWADTTVLAGDLGEAVRRLKAEQAGELQAHGGRTLIRWLLDQQLVDELILVVYPLVLGQGARLFPDTGRDLALELVDSRTTPKGVTLQTYRPSGRPQYDVASAEPRD